MFSLKSWLSEYMPCWRTCLMKLSLREQIHPMFSNIIEDYPYNDYPPPHHVLAAPSLVATPARAVHVGCRRVLLRHLRQRWLGVCLCSHRYVVLAGLCICSYRCMREPFIVVLCWLGLCLWLYRCVGAFHCYFGMACVLLRIGVWM